MSTSRAAVDRPGPRDQTRADEPGTPVPAGAVRHRQIFETAGIPIWQADLSGIGAALESLRARGVSDLGDYLSSNPGFVRSAIGLVGIVGANLAALRLVGARATTDLSASLGDMFSPDAEAAFAAMLIAIWDGRTPFETEAALRTLQGERRHVVLTAAFPDSRRDLSCVPVTLTDITARIDAEAKLRRSERGLRTLYRLTSAVGRASTLDEVYSVALDALSAALGADRASVLLFDDAGAMRFAAWRGLSDEYRAAATGHSPWTPDDRKAAPIAIGDAATDPRTGALRERILAEGIHALAFIPLAESGGLLGKFMVYFDQPHVFDEDELRLAESIASHVAHAIRQRRDEAALRESLAIVQIVNEGTPTLLYVKDRDGRMRMANPATLRALGVTAGDAIGHTALEYWPDKAAAAQVMANDRALMERGTAATLEEKIVLADGPHVFLSTKTPQRDASGAVVGLVGASIDITDRKRGEERQKLLIRELNHRVKNTLATVQAIAAQTLRGAESDREARRAFEARLLALSNAHNVLTRESWDGAAIDEIVATALAPHRAAGDDRFAVAGPAIRLAPKAALALAMALHELATNAAKYGALSVRDGRVHVEWSVGQDEGEMRFSLRWRESGGPAVVPPQRRGFGSRLIERGLSLELGGRAAIEFLPSGLSYGIDAPLKNLVWTPVAEPGPGQ